MRVITGKYKGRRFDVPRTFKARPTTDCAKENIFNVIKGYIDLEDTTALDLFAGTGSISIELLSRGCRSVVSVEADRDHASFIRQCMSKIGARNHFLIQGDAFKFIEKCHQQFDFIFADPPYQLPELPELPSRIFNAGILSPGGLFVFEHGKHNDFSTHPLFIDHRAYGSVNFSIFRIPAEGVSDSVNDTNEIEQQ